MSEIDPLEELESQFQMGAVKLEMLFEEARIGITIEYPPGKGMWVLHALRQLGQPQWAAQVAYAIREDESIVNAVREYQEKAGDTE